MATINGIDIRPGKGATGLEGSAYSIQQGGPNTPFISFIPRELLNKLDPRGRDFNPGNANPHLGFFDDPRKAAYFTAIFKADPKGQLDRWFAMDKPDARRWSADYNFPTELFKDPELAKTVEPVMKRWNEEIANHGERAKNYTDPGARDWVGLTKSLGIKGSQIPAIMPGDPQQNQAFVASLVKMSSDQAKNALLKKGIDLDDPATITKIQQAASVKEEINRIKQLIKY